MPDKIFVNYSHDLQLPHCVELRLNYCRIMLQQERAILCFFHSEISLSSILGMLLTFLRQFLFLLLRNHVKDIKKNFVEQPTCLVVGNDNYFSKMNLVKVFCNFISPVENQTVLVIVEEEVEIFFNTFLEINF